MATRGRTTLSARDGLGRCLAAAGLAAALSTGGAAAADDDWGPLAILGARVDPGEAQRLAVSVSESFSGAQVRTPVFVVRGPRPGPTLCLTAGVHGDEVNGVEIARRVLATVTPGELNGTLIAVPIVNLPALRRGSRYLPDRRDLNRYFPGRSNGSAASRIAHVFFEEVVRHCSALVDVHTGSFHRSNLHQVRADLDAPGVLELAELFGSAVVVNHPGRSGTLRRAAVEAGIPAITLEAGEPTRFDPREVELGVEGFERLLAGLGMRDGPVLVVGEDQRIYRRARWVRVDAGGILVSRVGLGDSVQSGEVLGTVFDPLSHDASTVRSPYRGRIIGIAVDQLVMPGFAAYHVGTSRAEEAEPEPEDEPEAPDETSPMDLEERPE